MDLIIFLLNKNVQIEIVCILNDHPVSALLKEALQRPETDLKRRFIKLLKELFARSKEKKLCITFSRLHDHQTLEDVSVWLVRGIHRNVCPYLMTVAPVFFIFSDPTYDGWWVTTLIGKIKFVPQSKNIQNSWFYLGNQFFWAKCNQELVCYS